MHLKIFDFQSFEEVPGHLPRFKLVADALRSSKETFDLSSCKFWMNAGESGAWKPLSTSENIRQ